MKNIDLRIVSREARKELNQAAVRMFKVRSKQIDIAETLGIRNSTITLLHAARERVNMISFITNQGKVQFMIYPQSFTAEVFIKFIKQLIKASNKKTFLIFDNLGVRL